MLRRILGFTTAARRSAVHSRVPYRTATFVATSAFTAVATNHFLGVGRAQHCFAAANFESAPVTQHLSHVECDDAPIASEISRVEHAQNGIESICPIWESSMEAHQQFNEQIDNLGDAIRDLFMKDSLGEVASEISRVVSQLLSHVECDDGFTALMYAARGGHESSVRLLLEYLADVNLTSE